MSSFKVPWIYLSNGNGHSQLTITPTLEYVIGNNSLVVEIGKFLRVVELISFRCAVRMDNGSYELITERNIQDAFEASLQEGLKLWGLSVNSLKNLLSGANGCCCFLSGSFLLHSLERDFSNAGDIDLFVIPNIDCDGKCNDGLQSISALLEQQGYKQKVSDNNNEHSVYHYPLGFQVINYDRKVKGVARRIQVVISSNNLKPPQSIVREFDVNIVRLYCTYKLRCPIVDVTFKMIHILKRCFTFSAKHDNVSKSNARIAKYVSKGFRLLYVE